MVLYKDFSGHISVQNESPSGGRRGQKAKNKREGFSEGKQARPGASKRGLS